MAAQSVQSADQATQVTNSALTTVDETVRGMDSVRETIAETEKRIKRLGGAFAGNFGDCELD